MKKIILVGIIVIIMSAVIVAQNTATMPLSKILSQGPIDLDNDSLVDNVDNALMASQGGINYNDCDTVMTGVNEELSCADVGFEKEECETKIGHETQCTNFEYITVAYGSSEVHCSEEHSLIEFNTWKDNFWDVNGFCTRRYIEIECCPINQDITSTNPSKTSSNKWDIFWNEDYAKFND